MWTICSQTLSPGEKRRVMLDPSVPGTEIPATLICGAKPGKTLLVCAGTHPDEYPGIAALVRLGQELRPDLLCGNVIVIHCLNMGGFRAKTRLVPEDGVNLNGDFPGRADGTPGQRLAHFAETALYPGVDFILDLHSGSPMEPLEECIFFPDRDEVRQAALEAARALSVESLLASGADSGLYSYAAANYHIPGLLLERGHSGRCLPEWIQADCRDVYALLAHLDMYPAEGAKTGSAPKRIYTRVLYPEAEGQGLWYPAVSAGAEVTRGQVLGQIRDFWDNVCTEYRAEGDGRVFYLSAGLAVNPGDSLVAYGLYPGD